MKTKFENLKGETLISVTGAVGDDVMDFVTESGKTFHLYHSQDCCEDVRINDICGDLSDLIGSPIVLAEESSNSDENP